MSESIQINNETLTFNKIWYVDQLNGNDSTGDGSENNPYYHLWNTINNIANDNDAIFVKNEATYEYEEINKNITIIGDYLKYNSKIVDKIWSNYNNINIYNCYLTTRGFDKWNEFFVYTHAKIYNCIFDGINTSYSNVYGSYYYYNCHIKKISNIYTTSYFYYCTFENDFPDTAKAIIINSIENVNINEKQRTYGVYSGLYAWGDKVKINSINYNIIHG